MTSADIVDNKYRLINVKIAGQNMPIIVRRNKDVETEPFYEDERIATAAMYDDVLDSEPAKTGGSIIGSLAATLIPVAISALPSIVKGISSLVNRKRSGMIAGIQPVQIPEYIKKYLEGKKSGRLTLSPYSGGSFKKDYKGQEIDVYEFD